MTNSAAHINEYIDDTIERLGFTPDLYYLHRIDPSKRKIQDTLRTVSTDVYADTPLEESIPALDALRKVEKTKYIGISECSAQTLRKANSSKSNSSLGRKSMILRMRVVAHIDAIQAEYSAFETLHEASGLIDTARELGITYVAYSPLGHGWLVDDFQYNSPDDFAPTDFRRTCKSPTRSLVDSSAHRLT